MSETKTEWRCIYQYPGGDAQAFNSDELSTRQFMAWVKQPDRVQPQHCELQSRTVTPWTPVEDKCKK